MEIKYYITNEQDLILALLERELCIRGISYVKIDNEVHFSDKIVRILDMDNDRSLIMELKMNRINILNNKFDKLFDGSICLTDNLIINEFIEVKDEIKDVKFPKQNEKKEFKRESHNNKMILKKYNRQNEKNIQDT